MITDNNLATTLPHPLQDQLPIGSVIDIVTTPIDNELFQETVPDVIHNQQETASSDNTSLANDSFSLCFENDSVSVCSYTARTDISNGEDTPSHVLVALDLEADVNERSQLVSQEESLAIDNSQLISCETIIDSNVLKSGTSLGPHLSLAPSIPSLAPSIPSLGISTSPDPSMIYSTSLGPSMSLAPNTSLSPSTSPSPTMNLAPNANSNPSLISSLGPRTSLGPVMMSLGPYTDISRVPCPPGVEKSFLNKSICPEIALVRSPFKLQPRSQSSPQRTVLVSTKLQTIISHKTESSSSPQTPVCCANITTKNNSRVKRNILKKMDTRKAVTRSRNRKPFRKSPDKNNDSKCTDRKEQQAITVNDCQKVSPQLRSSKETINQEVLSNFDLPTSELEGKIIKRKMKKRKRHFTIQRRKKCDPTSYSVSECKVPRPSVNGTLNVHVASDKKPTSLKTKKELMGGHIVRKYKRSASSTDNNCTGAKRSCDAGNENTSRRDVGVEQSSSDINNLHKSAQLNSDKKNTERELNKSQANKDSSSRQNGRSDLNNKDTPDKGKKRRGRQPVRRQSSGEKSEENLSPAKKWKCEFCGLGNNRKDLGYLYGPYKVKEMNNNNNNTTDNSLTDKENQTMDKERGKHNQWVLSLNVWAWSMKGWVCLPKRVTDNT